MRRHHVILGTKTTAGGEVITASSLASLDGVKLALEGDKIYCPACKSDGAIRCVGPRLDDTFNGVSFALEHDLCLCKCKTPPKLLTAQTRRFQDIKGGSFAQESPAQPVMVSAQSPTLCLECLVAAATRGAGIVARG